eukprot:CAMPEP_0201593898 /NCGR_PEP_ID=MMETSP0190_2-20130828/191385_1 /ASSEMBLY_ACC=CAM_ASM_000263 /TAXON_ID=37353 /ORGANISM="Rosalina sp." /LENGTH=62 /DNA_ID=CAMNT_0048053311 /DNA_START=973 /DNA_END=1161 /DNA_ORIENTATION=-
MQGKNRKKKQNENTNTSEVEDQLRQQIEDLKRRIEDLEALKQTPQLVVNSVQIEHNGNVSDI